MCQLEIQLLVIMVHSNCIAQRISFTRQSRLETRACMGVLGYLNNSTNKHIRQWP